MGDSFSKIDDDIEEYERLCELYGEESQGRAGVYGGHRMELKNRDPKDAAAYLVMGS